MKNKMKNKNKENDTPFYENSDYWKSPLAIFLFIGYIIYGGCYAIIWITKWLILSPIRPFVNSKFMCKQGFHKYRIVIGKSTTSWESLYKCKVCKKTKIVDVYD